MATVVRRAVSCLICFDSMDYCCYDYGFITNGQKFKKIHEWNKHIIIFFPEKNGTNCIIVHVLYITGCKLKILRNM